MTYYKEQEQLVTKENQEMTSELSDLRLQLQKISYESKENAITVESLKEANQDLMAELEELKKNLAEVRSAQKDATGTDKEKKKAEKMAQMMSGFDPSVRNTIRWHGIIICMSKTCLVRTKSMKRSVKSEMLLASWMVTISARMSWWPYDGS